MSLQKRPYPLLYGLSSTGKVKTWRTWVEEKANGTAVIYTEHGFEDGKLQLAQVIVAKGKNIGKANETSPFTQACSQAESKRNKKVDEQYAISKEALKSIPRVILPMLANSYKDRKHYITWPAIVQPKIDGIRCMARKVSKTEIEYTTRKGKFFTTLDHLTPWLRRTMLVGDVLDGELYAKGFSLQRIAGAVKRDEPSEDTTFIEYWVFDRVSKDSFDIRSASVKAAVGRLPDSSPVVYVHSKLVKTEKEMYRLHDQMVAAGYEGAIVRNLRGTYVPKHRSNDLLKVKHFEDAEFEIIGGKQGVGKDRGAITFICKTAEGKIFDCRPRGDYPYRRKLFQELDRLVSKQLTVRFQYLTDDGIPFLPIGIAVRDYE